MGYYDAPLSPMWALLLNVAPSTEVAMPDVSSAGAMCALLEIGNLGHADRLFAACPFKAGVALVSDWHTLGRVSPRCVLIITSSIPDELVRGVSALRAGVTGITAIAVIPKDPEVARSAARANITEVFWTSDRPAMVWDAVRASSQTCDLRARMENIVTLGSAPTLVRRALLVASRTTVDSVREWASLTGCDRRTLWRAWRAVSPESVGNGSPLRLEDILAWMLLIRAVSTHGRSWEARAIELHVHVSTLARLCSRLTGMQLSEADRLGPEAILCRFEELLARHIGRAPRTSETGDNTRY